jgi:hypothetical protein
MTADEFRSIALGFSDACEGSHMGHPDFRVHGKIFATLHYPDERWGMVKLPPEDQRTFVQAHPEVFVPAKGAWGRQGSTNVCLAVVDAGTMTHALGVAWRSVSAKPARASKKTS